MKHSVLALKKHEGTVTVNGEKVQMKLPEGCTGFCFYFETKKAARKYWGKDIECIRAVMGAGK